VAFRTQTITAVEGPASGGLYPYRPRRIRGGRVTQQQIADLWEGNYQPWATNYWERLDDTLHHLLGGTRFILPDEFLENVEGREHMVVIFPQKITTPLKIINLLGNNRPQVMRYAAGLSMTQEAMSTDVETWINAVLEHDIDGRPLLNYRELVGRNLIEGAVVVKCLSTDAHWRSSVSWLDILDEEEYMDLTPRKKRRYKEVMEVFETDEEEDDELEAVVWTSEGRRRNREGPKRYVRVDRDGVPVPKRRYHRDAAGRGPGDSDEAFVEDREASRRAYRRDQKEWLARRLPFEVEIISARNCIPLMDDNERIEAILVMREYDVIDAIGKDLIWGDDQDMLIPAPMEEQGGPVTVYELWHTDERKRPYVAYFVDGYAWTAFRSSRTAGNEAQIGATEPTEYTRSDYMPGAAEADDVASSNRRADAVIDLQKEYGCTTLPIRWFWGLHLPIADVTKKAIPFLWPVLSSINAAEGIATAMHIYAWRNAFAGSFIQLDPQILERYGSLFAKNGDLFRFSLGPMENVVVPGRPQIANAPDPGAGVQQLLQMLLQASAAMSPSDAAFGGSGSSSGHDRALSREYLQVALSQVLESARLAVKFVAERILEYAVWISEKTGRYVPVYANTPNPQISTRTGRAKPPTDIIELKPSWLKTNQEVHAYFKNDETDELKRQQLAQQHMQGLVPWDQYRKEAWDDDAPELTLIKIFSDQALRTPEGRNEVLEFARDLRSDEQDQAKEELVKEGLLSKDGLPTRARVPFTPQRLLGPEDAANGAAGLGGLADLLGLPKNGAGPGAAPNGAPVFGRGPGAGSAALPPGVEPPPGVPPELLARHLQLDRSHQAARALAGGAGPLGPIGGPANAQGLPGSMMPQPPPGNVIPGTAPAGPVGASPGAMPPEIMRLLMGPTPGPSGAPQARDLPPGVEGPSDIEPYPQKSAAAPGLPGMTGGKLGKASDVDSQLGGVIAAQLRRAAKQYHDKRRGPRVPSGRS
jgi:hypothetical protein